MTFPFIVFDLIFEGRVLDLFAKLSISNVLLGWTGQFNQNDCLEAIGEQHNVWPFVRDTDMYWERDRVFCVIDLYFPV